MGVYATEEQQRELEYLAKRDAEQSGEEYMDIINPYDYEFEDSFYDYDIHGDNECIVTKTNLKYDYLKMNKKCEIIKFPMSSDENNMKDKKCDYKTLAIMTLYSNVNLNEDHRFINKNNILLNKKEIESLSGNKIDTVCRNIKKLCRLGSDLVEAKNTNKGIVYIIRPLNENGRKFVKIEEDILRVLIDACSSNAIKTYILLKYRCGTKGARVTRKDIANNIGLSVKSDKNLKTITNIIRVLEKIDLITVDIEYVKEVESNGKEQLKKYNNYKIVDYENWKERFEK